MIPDAETFPYTMRVVSEILDFDNKNITCAKCEGGIKLKDRRFGS